jgi:cytochrome b
MRTTDEVLVWDLFVRVFHWLLAGGFLVAFVTEDELLGPHVWAGYLTLSLVLLRVVWGFVGTERARFRDFVFGPSRVIAYLKQVVRLEAPRYLGHNPAGGAMILALLLGVGLTGLSGLLLYGAESGGGLLGDVASMLGVAGERGAEALEAVHEAFANLTLALVFVHLAGVLVESLLHRENLVRAMFTGRKSAK